MEEIKKPERFYFNKESFKEPQYAGASPFVRYSSYIDLKQSKTNLVSDHKAVVETIQRETEESNKICYDNGFQDGCGESDDRHRNTIETMQNKIEELLLVADHRWDELKKAENKIEELEKDFCDMCKDLRKIDSYITMESPESHIIMQGVMTKALKIAKGIK